jgi:preprotein translocase subunit SecB
MKIESEHADKVQFERIWVREAVFRDVDGAMDVPTANQKVEDLRLSLAVSVTMAKEGLSAVVALRCVLEPNDKHPRMFEELSVTVEGQFSVADASAKGRLDAFAKGQAPILLFPYARQALTTLTGATRMGGLVIPPINMQQIVNAMQKSDEAAAAR